MGQIYYSGSVNNPFASLKSRTLTASMPLAILFFGLGSALPAQQLDPAVVIRGVDTAVHNRLEQIATYTVTEHYAVFKGSDEVHPIAEMTVKTLYRRETGKSYTIQAQSGSEIVRKLVLGTLLDHEKEINQPGTREGSWFTSANYTMQLKPEADRQIDGRTCLAIAATPKRKTPYLIDGTIWVDAQDFGVVQIQGTGSKSASVLSGPTKVMRQYTNINGFAMATHARAVSNSLFGQVIVKIDYSDYQIELGPAK